MVYVISDGTFLKIGYTRDIEKRMRDLQTANPRELRVIKAYETTCAKEDRRLESYLHSKFQVYRVKVGGQMTEWFSMVIRDEIDQAVNKLSRNDIGYCYESYATGLNSAQTFGVGLVRYNDLKKRYRKLKCEKEKLLDIIKKDTVVLSNQNRLTRERDGLLNKNRQLIVELDAALRRNRTLICKAETKIEATSNPMVRAKQLINEFPEMLDKHDLEQLFNKPFYEIIDKAAEVGAEINIGLHYFYKRDVLKEALEKGVAF